MATDELDEVDAALLKLLQEHSRYPATELADRVGVSDNTVHNRLERLEDAGIITDYTVNVDVSALGFDFYFLFTCTADVSERKDVAGALQDIPAVLEVTELMTGRENLLVKAVGSSDEEITRIAHQIDDLPVDIDSETLIRAEHASPVDYEAIRNAYGSS